MNPMSLISSMFESSGAGGSGATDSQGDFMQELLQMIEQLMQSQGGGQSQSSGGGGGGGGDTLGEIGSIVKDVAPIALAFL